MFSLARLRYRQLSAIWKLLLLTVVILVIVALYAIFAGVYDYRIQWLILALTFGYAILWYLSESRKIPGEQARKKRQTITFITVLAFTFSILYLSRLMADYEAHAKSGYSQVTFLLGVLIGLITAMVLNKIDARFADNEEREEVTE